MQLTGTIPATRAEITVIPSEVLQALQRGLVIRLNQETRDLGLMPENIKQFDSFFIAEKNNENGFHEGALVGRHYSPEVFLVITYGAVVWKDRFRALSTLRKALVQP